MNGITFIPAFISEPAALFSLLDQSANWDTSMAARKTASFGVAYNYAQMFYPFVEMLPELKQIAAGINHRLGFTPNNCLINYYPDGTAKMGFHTDQVNILAPGTGIVVISLGATRVLRFRRITNKDEQHDYQLPAGSLLYMTQEVQQQWQHAIPPAPEASSRMSLTFRNIQQS